GGAGNRERGGAGGGAAVAAAPGAADHRRRRSRRGMGAGAGGTGDGSRVSSAVVGSRARIAGEELRDRAAIAALSDDWERLRQNAASNGRPRGPFLSAPWFAIYASSLAVGRRALRLLLAHRDGRVAGLLPLFAERRLLNGAPARVLRSLSDDHSQRFDALV